jgi:hypothetical protein
VRNPVALTLHHLLAFANQGKNWIPGSAFGGPGMTKTFFKSLVQPSSRGLCRVPEQHKVCAAIPAKAGTRFLPFLHTKEELDSRFRGNDDEEMVWLAIPTLRSQSLRLSALAPA